MHERDRIGVNRLAMPRRWNDERTTRNFAMAIPDAAASQAMPRVQSIPLIEITPFGTWRLLASQ